VTKPCVMMWQEGRIYRGQNTPRKRGSDNGMAEGIMRHLSARGDLTVVYFGQGDVDVPGVIQVVPDVEEIDPLITAREQEARWKNDWATLAPYEPRLSLEVCSMSDATNYARYGTLLRQTAVRHIAPKLAATSHFKMPRIVVSADIRAYPLNREMLDDPWLAPVAMLCQVDRERRKRWHGREVVMREVYSGAETWPTFPRAPAGPRPDPVTMVARAHLADGFRQPARAAAFDALFGGDLLRDLGLKIYGGGWEAYGGYDPEVMVGERPHAEVMGALARARCGPIVESHLHNTGPKMFMYLSLGCRPIPYGRGEPYTCDPYGRHVPLGSPFRVQNARELRRAVAGNRFAEIDTTPRWGTLDDCVDATLAGRRDWERFGGYRLR